MNENASPQERYTSIRSRIAAAAGDRSAEITLIAVSKTQPIEAIEELYRLGQRDFGENYAQELAEKAVAADQRGLTGIRWHFIGHLQTNKVKQILPFAHSIHAIDSEKLAREISKRAGALGLRVPCFIEVNVDQEESKAGVGSEEACTLANAVAALPGLDLRGLMCIPHSESGASGDAFRRLRDLELKCRPSTQGWLSMGMTSDFETAIREGATHVRIGTALFGPRRARSA